MFRRKTRTFSCIQLLLITTAFAAMAIQSCGGGGSSSPGTPDISLSPADTDFGVTVLDKSSDKRVTIQNTGNGNLRIGQIAQQDPLAIPFNIVTDECSGAIVSPSSSCDLVIRFSPTSQVDYSDSFDIPSNDSDEGVLTATLSGKGRSLNVNIARVGKIDPLLQTVMLIVSVTDRNDAPVISLLDNNFSLFENSSPKGIFSFSNVINAPVSIGLVLDYSSSMIPFTSDVEAAAKSFIDLLDPANDEAEVIKFATLIEVMQPFTNDQIALKNSIDAQFSGVQSGTRLLDAIWDSIESTSLRSNGRLAVVAVSDGEDPNSTRTINEVLQNAIGKNVSIYTIGIGNVDTVLMQQIAAETGGQFFHDPTASDLANIYAKISEILSNQYTIEYQTSSPGGSTVSIGVEVDDNGQLGEYSRDATI